MENSINHMEMAESGKPILFMNKDEFKYINTPIGKAIYKESYEKKEDELVTPKQSRYRGATKPTDRIKCKICGKIYSRNCKTHHDKTQHHLFYDNMNKKLRELLLN
jgi:hypothetical protein